LVLINTSIHKNIDFMCIELKKLFVKIKWEEIKRRLKNVLREWVKFYCKDCKYKSICKRIAHMNKY